MLIKVGQLKTAWVFVYRMIFTNNESKWEKGIIIEFTGYTWFLKVYFWTGLIIPFFLNVNPW